MRDEVQLETVGAAEVRAAYDFIHADYDTFWLAEAGRPTAAHIARVPWSGRECVFEAGCGTGYATVQLAKRAADVVAVDLSAAMLGRAEERIRQQGARNVHFAVGDALERLTADGPFDVVFTSWVLGYIPLAPFFAAAHHALARGGRVAFLVHRKNSPREPLEIFAEIVGENPAVMKKRVAFDFPRDAADVRSLVEAAGFAIEMLAEDVVSFTYATAGEVLRHLLKSGAGTAYYDAVDPVRRPQLTDRFLAKLAQRRPPGAGGFTVNHEFVACVARKT